MNKENEIEIKFDKRNYRKHSDKNKKVIRKSLEELGAGRSVLIDADGSLIAGNGVYEQAQRLGIPVEVVKTDGKKLVVVQRTDLHEDDDKRKRLALADNSASDTSEFDVELLKEDFDLGELDEWGVKIKDEPETAKISELDFTSVYYEPKQKPNLKLADCVNLDKFNAKIKVLDEYNLTDEEKKVLTLFAYRFIKIDFEAVANYYYFCANEEMQKAIERLRLVFVDSAEGGGFVEDDMLKLTESMLEGIDNDD